LKGNLEFSKFKTVLKNLSYVNKKILIMLIIAGIGIIIQMFISSVFPASEISFALGVALAIFGIIIAIQIALYSKVKREMS
jgi:hypothetical protein